MVLAALVDEHCDPTLCEYAVAAAGGLIVPTATKAKWPMKAGRSAGSTGLEKAVLTQQWEDDLDAETTSLRVEALEAGCRAHASQAQQDAVGVIRRLAARSANTAKA